MRMQFRRPLLPHGPAGWQMAMATIAGPWGIALLVSEDAYRGSRVYRHIAPIVPEDVLGSVLIAYALLIVLANFFLAARWKALLSIASAGMWSLLGYSILLGSCPGFWNGFAVGFRAACSAPDFLSGIGLSLLGFGIGSVVCAGQWARD